MRLFLKRALLALLLLALVLYGAFALTSHPVEPHPYFASGDVLVIAHRGGKGLAPENTLAAFTHSAALGVDVLEMDLRQSSDGALIVLHDRRVDRTTNGQGAADSLSLAQLKQLDAGYHFSPDGQTFPYRGQGVAIPTLDEVFTAFPNMRFLIEIKNDSAALVNDFCRTIQRFQLSDRVIAASFHDRPLENLRQICPEVATSASSSAGMSFIFLHWAAARRGVPPRKPSLSGPGPFGQDRPNRSALHRPRPRPQRPSPRLDHQQSQRHAALPRPRRRWPNHRLSRPPTTHPEPPARRGDIMGDPVALNVQHLTKNLRHRTKRLNRPRRCEFLPRDRIYLRSRRPFRQWQNHAVRIVRRAGSRQFGIGRARRRGFRRSRRRPARAPPQRKGRLRLPDLPAHPHS